MERLIISHFGPKMQEKFFNSHSTFQPTRTKFMLLLEFSMSPMDKGESLSPYVSRSLQIVADSGLDYRITAMGTILEGEWDETLDVVRQCFEKMRSDCDRITCSVKIDYRKGGKGRLESKIASVEAKLGKTLKK